MTHRSHILLSLATVLVVSAPLTLAEEVGMPSAEDTTAVQQTTVSPVRANIQARAQIEDDRQMRLQNDRMVQRSLRNGVEYHLMLKRKLAARQTMRSVTPATTTAVPAGRSHSAKSWLSGGSKNYSPDELMMVLTPEHPARPSWLPHEAKWVPKN